MSESHASYQSYVPPTPEAQMTPAERERQSAAFKQPGRISYQTATGEVSIEKAEPPAAPVAPDTSEWWQHATLDSKQVDIFAPGLDETKVMIPGPDGQPISMRAARNAGLIRKDGAGRWLPFASPESSADTKSQDKKDQKSAEEQQTKQQDSEPIKWESPEVDQMVQIYAPLIGESGMQSLVSRAVTTGEGELPDNIAESMSQIAGNTVTPANVKAAYATAYEAAVAKANAIVAEQGVQDVDGFYEWLTANHSGKATEARYAFTEGNGRPLANLAKEYVASHGGGLNPADVERLFASNNKIVGGRLFKSERGTPMVEINGRQMTLADAAAAGFVKVSVNEV